MGYEGYHLAEPKIGGSKYAVTFIIIIVNFYTKEKKS